MPEPTTFLLGQSLNTYTYFVGLALFAALILLIMFTRGRISASEASNAYLAGVMLAIILGRAFHVALHWDYFALNTAEIMQVRAGGIDWHGAFIGALMGLGIVARVRRLDSAALADAAALALPLIAYAAWWGCAAVGCAYGAEVGNLAQYSPVVVWEQPDIYGLTAPRFAVQRLGAWLSVMLMALGVALALRGGLMGRRLWLMQVLFSAGMLGIAFYRGDAVIQWGALRADQVLDILFAIAGMMAFIINPYGLKRPNVSQEK